MSAPNGAYYRRFLRTSRNPPGYLVGFCLFFNPAWDDYCHTALLRMKKSPPEQDLFLRMVNQWLLARLGQWRRFVLPLGLFQLSLLLRDTPGCNDPDVGTLYSLLTTISYTLKGGGKNSLILLRKPKGLGAAQACY